MIRRIASMTAGEETNDRALATELSGLHLENLTRFLSIVGRNSATVEVAIAVGNYPLWKLLATCGSALQIRLVYFLHVLDLMEMPCRVEKCQEKCTF